MFGKHSLKRYILKKFDEEVFGYWVVDRGPRKEKTKTFHPKTVRLQSEAVVVVVVVVVDTLIGPKHAYTNVVVVVVVVV